VGISISLLFDKSLYVRRSDLVQFHVAEGRQQMVFGDALLCSQATFSQVCISVPGVGSLLFMPEPRLTKLAESDRSAFCDVYVVRKLSIDPGGKFLGMALVVKPLLAAGSL
jgi:hypothetical protein